MLSIAARSKGAQNWVRQAVIAFASFDEGRSLSKIGDGNVPTL